MYLLIALIPPLEYKQCNFQVSVILVLDSRLFAYQFKSPFRKRPDSPKDVVPSALITLTFELSF